MDPWGHLAPWLFKDIIEKDDSECEVYVFQEVLTLTPCS